MGMPLHCTRNKNEEAFDDMFRNCREKINRVDELHSSPENDAVFVFIIWGDDDIQEILEENVSPLGYVKRLDEGLFAYVENVLG